MKRIFIAIVVCFLLVTNLSVVFADAPCDEQCVQEAISGHMSSDQLKNYGTGNVVRAVANYYEGNLWKALRVLHLAPTVNVADWNVNTIYHTKFDGTVIGFYICQSDFQYCETGEVFGYIQEGDKLKRIFCVPDGPCREDILLEGDPDYGLAEFFFRN